MYLYGASGHAKVIIDILEASGKTISGIFDDNPAIYEISGIKVTGKFSSQSLDAPMIICIGDNQTRARVANGIKVSFGTALHPTAILSPSSRVGEGTVVMQSAIIQADTSIGKHVIVNTGASIDHDCVVGDFAHISPGAILTGNVHIGEGTHVGAGAVVIPGVRIGKWCTIGAGAVIIRDVPDGVTVVGNPGRVVG